MENNQEWKREAERWQALAEECCDVILHMRGAIKTETDAEERKRLEGELAETRAELAEVTKKRDTSWEAHGLLRGRVRELAGRDTDGMTMDGVLEVLADRLAHPERECDHAELRRMLTEEKDKREALETLLNALKIQIRWAYETLSQCPSEREQVVRDILSGRIECIPAKWFVSLKPAGVE